MDDIHETLKTFATKEDLEKFATKEDVKAVADSVEEMLHLFKNFKIGINIGGRVFGFSGRFIFRLSALIAALLVMWEPIKILFAWVFHR